MKEMPLRQAAAAYSVPKDSLNRRIKGKLKRLSQEDVYENVFGRYRAILLHEQEKDLVDYMIKIDAAFYGLCIKGCSKDNCSISRYRE